MATLTSELVIDLVSIEGFKEDNVILCGNCGKEIDVDYFKDVVSLEFFNIAGFCQTCQDQLFDDDDRLL